MNLFHHGGLSPNDGDTGSPPRGPVLSAMGLPGHFPGRLNLQRKFVQDSENPKFGKKDWKIPRAGRIIKESVYAFLRAALLGKRPAVYAHDPGCERCVQGIAAEYGVLGQPPVQRESQSLGDHPRPSAGGVAPGRTERIMLCKLEKEFSYELPPYYPGKY